MNDIHNSFVCLQDNQSEVAKGAAVTGAEQLSKDTIDTIKDTGMQDQTKDDEVKPLNQDKSKEVSQTN